MASLTAAPMRSLSVRASTSRVSSRPAVRSLVVRAQAQRSEASSLQVDMAKAIALSSVATTFLAAGNANAAQEIAELAAGGDGRLGVLSLLLLPAVGWVTFNIGGPALNQLKGMDTKTKAKARALAAGLGLGAALMVAQQADAAQEVAQLAAGDNRIGIIATLFIPVIGWVGFNILGPALNQLKQTSEKNSAPKSGIKKRAAVVGLGLGLSLMAATNADAATEVARLAAGGDGRFGVITTLFLPVVGWVLFNIFGPAKAQFDNMGGK